MRLIEKYGEYITGKRIEQGLTLKQLSEKSKVPERNLLAIETEKTKSYSLHHLRECLKALNLRLSEIIYD